MELINNLISEDLVQAIGWTIVHSLWQAAFVALIMSAYLNLYQKEKSIVRYRIALSSLYIMLGLSIITFCTYYFNADMHSPQITRSSVAINISAMSGFHYIQNCTLGLVHHFDFITTMWITGMVVFALKFVGGYALIKRYEFSGQEIYDSKVHIILNDLLNKMNLKKPIRILESAKVHTPMMLGHLKPVILLPIGIVNQLQLNEVEAILAHELSHISRSDFLQNIMQSFIEIIYYYHPAVWWISANVRAERENCCDEEAVRICGSAINYAKALVKIEEIQYQVIPALAVPFARDKHSLLYRVSRVLNQPQNRSQIKEKLMATIMLFSVCTLFGTPDTSALELDIPADNISVYTSGHEQFNIIVTEKEASNLPVNTKKGELIKKIIFDSEGSKVVIDTIPSDDRGSNAVTSIESTTNDGSFSLKIDNGVIQEFKINGQEVDDASTHFKIGKNNRVIKTEDGSILLKEFDPGLNQDKIDQYKIYDLGDLVTGELLKAPFKIESHDSKITQIKNKSELSSDLSLRTFSIHQRDLIVKLGSKKLKDGVD